MATANENKSVMLKMFEQKAKTTSFLSSLATNIRKTRAVEIEIDIKRGKEFYAVDIIPGAGSRANKKKRYTTKTYEAPLYDESATITAQELEKRLPGRTKYDAADEDYAAEVTAILSDEQIELQEKEIRAIELQARDAFFSGKIVLHNGDEIDFKKKATHDVAVAVKWDNASGVPLTDLEAACELCRKDGLIGTTSFNLIVANDVVEALKGNAQFVEKANLRHVQNVSMGMPGAVNTNGAVPHGQFSAGSYIINLWAYPQFYDVPVGFGLADEGTKQPYIPSASALLMPADGGLRIDLVYGGVPTVAPQVNPRLEAMGLTSVPMTIEADFHPYAHLDQRAACIEVGVRSRPLFIPHQIDGFVTLNTLV